MTHGWPQTPDAACHLSAIGLPQTPVSELRGPEGSAGSDTTFPYARGFSPTCFLFPEESIGIHSRESGGLVKE